MVPTGQQQFRQEDGTCARLHGLLDPGRQIRGRSRIIESRFECRHSHREAGPHRPRQRDDNHRLPPQLQKMWCDNHTELGFMAKVTPPRVRRLDTGKVARREAGRPPVLQWRPFLTGRIIWENCGGMG